MRCDLCPYGETPSVNQDVMDDYRLPLLGPSLEGPSLPGMAPPCSVMTSPSNNGVLPWAANQSFRDDPYWLVRMREPEEDFSNVGFNLYGFNQSRDGMLGPGCHDNGYMWSGANGSPSDSGHFERMDVPPADTQREPGPGVNALPARPRPGVWTGEVAIEVKGESNRELLKWYRRVYA